MTITKRSGGGALSWLSHPIWLPALLAGACWLYFLAGSGMDMSIRSMSVAAISPRISGAGGMAMTHQNAPGLPTTLFMWWTMMLAMMLPGTFRLLRQAGSHPGGSLVQITGFVSGYALVWLMFCVIATLVQFFLIDQGVLDGMKLWSSDRLFSAALLVLAGAWQFMPWKLRSLLNCHSDRMSPPGARSGVRFGGHCMLASAPLMSLLFVGGVMNVYWVVGLTAVATIEKWASRPRTFTLATGVACLLMALAVLLY